MPSMNQRAGRLLACLLLAGLAAGCTRWERMPALPPPEDPVTRWMNAARLTARGTPAVVLREVQVTPDSVIGWGPGQTDPSGLLSGPRRRVAVHRDDVLLLEQTVPDRAATVRASLLGVVAAACGVVMLYFVSHSG